jgi:O-antigen ligase
MYSLLMLSLIAWMVAGWYVIGGVMPLYPVPLSLAILMMFVTGRVFILNKALRNVLVLLVILCAWVAVSNMLANDSSRGAGVLLGYMSGAAILMVTYHSIVEFSQIRRALAIYAFIHLLALGLGVIQIKTGRFYPSEAAYEGGATGFEGMNYAFGKNYLPLVAAGVALSIFPALQIKGGRSARWWLLAVGLTGIVISGSRSTQLGCAAMFLVAIIVSRRWSLLLLSTLVAAGFGVLVTTSEKWGILFENSLGDASGGRFSFWGAGLNMISERPWFGVGAGNFKLMMPAYLTYDGALALQNTESVKSGIAAHNVFINIAAESGIVAAIVYIAFYLYIVSLTWRIARKNAASVEARLIAYAGLFYLVAYFVDMNFHNYGDENTIWFFAGLILAMEKLGADGVRGFVLQPNGARPRSKNLPW